MGADISTRREIVVRGNLVLIRASLITPARGLVLVRIDLILVTYGAPAIFERPQIALHQRIAFLRTPVSPLGGPIPILSRVVTITGGLIPDLVRHIRRALAATRWTLERLDQHSARGATTILVICPRFQPKTPQKQRQTNDCRTSRPLHHPIRKNESATAFYIGSIASFLETRRLGGGTGGRNPAMLSSRRADQRIGQRHTVITVAALSQLAERTHRCICLLVTEAIRRAAP